MRIVSQSDINKLGAHARVQIEAAFKQERSHTALRDGNNHLKHAPPSSKTQSTDTSPKKKKKRARVMRTAEGLSYCPWPSGDPFVAIFQRLERKYGLYEHGGMLVSELIIMADNAEKDWRFDLALISPITEMTFSSPNSDAEHCAQKAWVGMTHLLIETDGYGDHRSKDAFQNDRAKQTHALRQGFVVKRLTNHDARTRLDEIIHDIEIIMSYQRIYQRKFTIQRKGMTYAVFRWDHENGAVS